MVSVIHTDTVLNQKYSKKEKMKIKTGLGQDSHKFDLENQEKVLVLAGVIFNDETPLKGNSDADVVLHAVTNSISSITGKNIIGKVSDDMCKNQGITDSREYLKEALKYFIDYKIHHVSISIECEYPKITPKMEEMKKSLSELLSIDPSDIGITATTGEGLTAFGRGEGIQVFSLITATREK